MRSPSRIRALSGVAEVVADALVALRCRVLTFCIVRLGAGTQDIFARTFRILLFAALAAVQVVSRDRDGAPSR